MPARPRPRPSSPPSGGGGSRSELQPRPPLRCGSSPEGWRNSDIGRAGGELRSQTVNSGAAMVAELASSGGGEVLAAVADTERRAPLAREGVRLVDAFSLEAEPELARGFEHVVLVDPPACERVAEPARASGAATAAILHAGLGGGRARVLPLGPRPAPCPAAGADLGLQGAARGRRLRRRAAARGARRAAGPRSRRPEAAARCFRVLTELGLVQGDPGGGDGTVGVVSSAETELERSGAFRAYSARYKECLRFLERHRHR